MKKYLFTGIAGIVISAVLMLAFIIGGVVKIQSGPAAAVERLENAINGKDLDKALACFGATNEWGVFGSVNDLPYSGKRINLIPGEYEEIDGDPNYVKMQVGVVYKGDGESGYDTDTLRLFREAGRWYIELF